MRGFSFWDMFFVVNWLMRYLVNLLNNSFTVTCDASRRREGAGGKIVRETSSLRRRAGGGGDGHGHGEGGPGFGPGGLPTMSL